MMVLLALFCVGAVAGFIDAIAGGGGMLTVPALLMTGLPPDMVLATNKGQSVFGSGTALQRFRSSPLLDHRRAYQSFVPALAGAALGVWAMLHLPSRVLTPLVMTLLVAVAVFMIFHRPPDVVLPPRRRSFALVAAVAFLLAAYDGFFGPGTGTFLILAYAYLWRDPLDAASANAKVVNFASNLASMVTFAVLGRIVWKLSLAMAGGQIIGGYLGAHCTIRVGRPLVRVAVVVVSIGLVIYLGWRFTHTAAPPTPAGITASWPFSRS